MPTATHPLTRPAAVDLPPAVAPAVPPARSPDPGAEAFHRYRTGGGEVAFQELLTTYLPSVRHICRRILGMSALSDDAVQETFIKTARYAHTVVGDPGAWIRACAINSALSLRRAEKARYRRERVYAEDHSSLSIVEEPPWEQTLVLHCLTLLNEQDRHVLIEHYLMGRSQTDIAQGLGISQVAVHKRITRALTCLRMRMVANGAADGLHTLASMHRAGHACVVPDPMAWLLVAAAGSRRQRLVDALIKPIEALVQAAILEHPSYSYHESCVQRSASERAVRWMVRLCAGIGEMLHPSMWHQPLVVPVPSLS